MTRLEVAALVVVGLASLGACEDEGSPGEPLDHELIGTCFDEPPEASEVYSLREGDQCDSSSFQVFAAVRPAEGRWPGAAEEELTEDERRDLADAVRGACRSVLRQEFGEPERQVFGYSSYVHSEWDRAEGTSLCLTTPPVMDVP
jgi:hypothetical protein